MGCWNQTCGISQIHIRGGEKVMIFPVSSASYGGLHYTTPFYTPLAVPFYGEYNDYGAAENCTGVGLQLALDTIRDKLVEVEQGTNQYHDIAVKKEGFNEELFWDAVHEERLKIGGFFEDRSHKVDVMMIKQSIFDQLAQTLEFQTYDYDQTAGKITYFNYKLQDVLDGVPEVVEASFTPRFKVTDDVDPELAKQLHDIMFRMEPVNAVARNLLLDENGEKKKCADGINYAAKWLEHFASHLSDGFSVSQQMNAWMQTLVEAGDREAVSELLTDHLKMKFVDNFLMMTRKFWSPQAGKGSQANEHEGYQALIAAMTHVLAAEKAEWDDEYEDEE